MPSPKLATYRTKRDFSQTPEPRGQIEIAPSPHRRFVIQKHDATRLHYDLRLELHGVFKSWAVTRGPSLDPQDKRLAVEVEDHPLDYGDFEGTIPKGQYGGGTVQVWDRGYWLANNPDEGLKKGDLKFALEGEKLHGEWVLVRMKHDRNGGKRTNWLLIKHRDKYAKTGKTNDILDHDKSVASGRSLKQIAEGKGRKPTPFMLDKATTKIARADAVWDSRKGSAADARKALQSQQPRSQQSEHAPQTHGRKRGAQHAMPDMIAPQLCTLVARPPSQQGWIHEIKFDGYRMQLRIENGDVTLKTRKGLDWTEKFSAIAKTAKALPDMIIDGEIVALNHKGIPDFSALQAALSEGDTDNLIFFAFDLLFAEGEDLRKLPLLQRKETLKTILQQHHAKRTSTIRYVEHLTTGGDAILRSACKMSIEGVVSKRADASYQSGRTHNWTKAKCRAGHEVVIGGWKSTGNKFRSLMVGVYRDGHLTYTGIVGTGYGHDTVKRLMPALKAATANTSPFTGDGAPSGGKNIHWLKPELVAEIEFAGWTELTWCGRRHSRDCARTNPPRRSKPRNQRKRLHPISISTLGRRHRGKFARRRARKLP